MSRASVSRRQNLFLHRKTRYCGLAKNTAQLSTLFAFANLAVGGKRLTITNSPNPSGLQEGAEHRAKSSENTLDRLVIGHFAPKVHEKPE